MAYLNTAAAYAAILAAKDTGNPADKVTWAELSNILRSISDDIDTLRTIEANYVSTALSYSNPAWLTELAWSKISGTPTSLSGYGITDAVDFNAIYVNPAFIGSLEWSKITGTPTTVQGYGISGGTLSGTAGAGFLGYAAQSSAPSTPISGFRLYANSANALSWVGANGFVRTFDGTANTANRVYTLPDVSGTFGLLGAAQTWDGLNTFTSVLNATGGVGTTGATDFRLFANNVQVARFFQSTGNFNIGSSTTDAGFRLNVEGRGNFTSGIRIAGTGSTPFLITQDTVSGVNSFLSIANSVASLRIDATTSEITLSTLSNNFRISSAQGNFNIANSTTGGTFRIGHASGETYFDSQQNNRLRFRTNTGSTTVELMRMENTGNILIGTTTDTASAILNVTSTTKGVLVPRMTTAQRTAIASPATGLILYDTDLAHICYFDGSSWRKISHSPA